MEDFMSQIPLGLTDVFLNDIDIQTSLAASVRLCSALAQEAIIQRFQTPSLSPITLVRTGIGTFSQSIL